MPPQTYSGLNAALPDFGYQPEHPRVEATVWREADGSLLLEGMWNPWSEGELRDGDRYRLRMTTAAGRVVASVERTVTYPVPSRPLMQCELFCKLAMISASVAEGSEPDLGTDREVGTDLDGGT